MLEAEEIGQKLRTPAWIDSLLCTSGTTCLTLAQQQAIFVDPASLKAKSIPNRLRDRIVGLYHYRASTWTNPYTVPAG